MGLMRIHRFTRPSKGGYTWLLVALCILMFSDVLHMSARATSVLSAIADTLVLIAAVYAISRHRIVMMTLAPLGAATVTGLWVLATIDSDPMWLVMSLHLTMLATLGCVLAYVLMNVMTTSYVTSDTIRGAICAYLLMAAVFAGLYSFIQIIHPGDAFAVHESMAPPDKSLTWFNTTEPVVSDARVKNELMYFSFTTMTTLGYGDIVPTVNASRTLTSLQAVIGQLFLAILIARLVAARMMTEHAENSSANSGEGSDPPR